MLLISCSTMLAILFLSCRSESVKLTCTLLRSPFFFLGFCDAAAYTKHWFATILLFCLSIMPASDT